MKKLYYLVLFLSLNTSVNATVLYDTINDADLYNGSRSLDIVGLKQSFTVPTGETWTLSDIFLNMYLGGENNLTLSILDSTNVVRGVTANNHIFEVHRVVHAKFLFDTPLPLSPGNYEVLMNCRETRCGGNHWVLHEQTGTFDIIINGIVPVPAAVWFMGSGLLGLIGFSRKNKTQER